MCAIRSDSTRRDCERSSDRRRSRSSSESDSSSCVGLILLYSTHLFLPPGISLTGRIPPAMTSVVPWSVRVREIDFRRLQHTFWMASASFLGITPESCQEKNDLLKIFFAPSVTNPSQDADSETPVQHVRRRRGPWAGRGVPAQPKCRGHT